MSDEGKGNLKGVQISFVIIVAAMILFPYGLTGILNNFDKFAEVFGK